MTSLKTITCAAGLVLGLVLGLGAHVAAAAEAFTLSSSTFKDGGMMPGKTGGAKKDNPNCLGENISPQLSWSNPPAGTKSYAMIVVDPQARNGFGLDHWIAYGIPVSVTDFAEGEVSGPSDKYVGGSGNFGQPNYSGPCTPVGAPHHYNFTLIATDLDAKDLPAGLTREQLLAKLEGHAKGATGLVGLFVHP
ncbi:Raf kinase inhibitor-like YbhB/YbcL family protein [Nitrobacteraceae bacterium AZCC 2146]|jgi:Raf kinase inhibitor-like YbhB/YbcL family protein